MDHSEHARRRITEHWTTKEGERVAWADLETRHLWNIARMLARSARRMMRLHDDPAEIRRRWHVRIDNVHAKRMAYDPAQADAWERRRTHAHAVVERNDLAGQRQGIRTTIERTRNKLCMAIDELDYRGALPTWDDLRVAWDRACGGDGGPNIADDPEQRPWCLIELWVGFRGEPTTTAEWETQQACSD